MALADYYARGAIAASQVLAGFDEQRFRATLERVRVGIAFGRDAVDRAEGRALLDFLVRLVSRLYPTLVFRAGAERDALADEMKALASRINPAIEYSETPTIEIVVGEEAPASLGAPRIFVGSNGWDAFVASAEPRTLGNTANPFGAGVAACLAAANAFRAVFLEDAAPDTDATLSVLELQPRTGANPRLSGDLGEVALIGVGAIGNAAAWALARTPMNGVLHLVDHESVDLGNLQRYVLAERSEEAERKVDVAARYFAGAVYAKKHASSLADFVVSSGHSWPRMLLALDTARDRRAAQASMPRWVANAWTQPGDLGVSIHEFLEGACVSCLYLPDRGLENEDAVFAGSFGVTERLMQIRTLLHTGQGVPRDLLQAIADARALPLERLLPFEGRPVRALYTQGFCGGAVVPLGEAGTPRTDVHVPLAHQSALAGVLLAATAVRDALGLTPPGTHVTRIDLLHPIPPYMTQPAAKDPRGICICQDVDFRHQYARKYASELRPDGQDGTAQLSPGQKHAGFTSPSPLA